MPVASGTMFFLRSEFQVSQSSWASEMAQLVKVPGAKPEEQSPAPRWWKEKTNSQKLSPGLPMHAGYSGQMLISLTRTVKTVVSSYTLGFSYEVGRGTGEAIVPVACSRSCH